MHITHSHTIIYRQFDLFPVNSLFFVIDIAKTRYSCGFPQTTRKNSLYFYLLSGISLLTRRTWARRLLLARSWPDQDREPRKREAARRIVDHVHLAGVESRLQLG